MRFFLGCILIFALSVLPPSLRAGTEADDGSSDAKATVSENGKTSLEKPARTDATAEPAKSNLDLEIEELRDQLQTQSELIKQQQERVQALEEQLKTSTAGRENLSSSAPAATPASAVSSAVPVSAASAASATIATASPADPPAPPQGNPPPENPLQIRIGSAYITPVGFMDFTGVWRSHDGGSGIGTNFGGIPYGATSFQGNLSEFRFSMQNSRVGFRVDAMVKGAHVIGYLESDFLGNNPGNVAVSSNSNTLRSRLYWVDVRKGAWEVLGGQTWSLITPGRTGISPLPGDLFYTQDIDVNYQAGLVWGRIPELRFVYHASPKVAFAAALDASEQYVGGSAGGPQITLPTAFTTAGSPAATAYSLSASSSEFNNGQTTLNVPNVAPDVIVKLAFDPSSRFHVEVGGLERQFKLWNPTTLAKFSETGAGGFLNLGVGLFKGFRLLTNNFYSDGGGRYIFGQVPDLVVRTDGSPSGIHAASTVSGFEYTHGNSFFYAYYGGIYVPANIIIDTTGKSVGYGFTGGPSSQNRTIQEGTLGFNQTMWKDARYGALNLMGQYSYLTRNPWSVAVGSPRSALLNMVFLNLRYTLPGGAPNLER
jgi:hypothetical protein